MAGHKFTGRNDADAIGGIPIMIDNTSTDMRELVSKASQGIKGAYEEAKTYHQDTKKRGLRGDDSWNLYDDALAPTTAAVSKSMGGMSNKELEAMIDTNATKTVSDLKAKFGNSGSQPDAVKDGIGQGNPFEDAAIDQFKHLIEISRMEGNNDSSNWTTKVEGESSWSSFKRFWSGTGAAFGNQMGVGSKEDQNRDKVFGSYVMGKINQQLPQLLDAWKNEFKESNTAKQAMLDALKEPISYLAAIDPTTKKSLGVVTGAATPGWLEITSMAIEQHFANIIQQGRKGFTSGTFVSREDKRQNALKYEIKKLEKDIAENNEWLKQKDFDSSGLSREHVLGVIVADAKKLSALRAELNGTIDPNTFADGGHVGQYIGIKPNWYNPRGSDTVPAMLTPGEFVINRQASQKYRPLLEQINGNKNVGGSTIQYRQDGGIIHGASNKNVPMVFDTSSLTGIFDSFRDNAGILRDAFSSFGQNVSAFETYTQTLKELHIPDRIEMQGTHTVNLNINGLSVLNGLQDMVRNIVVSEINRATGGYQLNANSGIPSGQF